MLRTSQDAYILGQQRHLQLRSSCRYSNCAKPQVWKWRLLKRLSLQFRKTTPYSSDQPISGLTRGPDCALQTWTDWLSNRLWFGPEKARSTWYQPSQSLPPHSIPPVTGWTWGTSFDMASESRVGGGVVHPKLMFCGSFDSFECLFHYVRHPAPTKCILQRGRQVSLPLLGLSSLQTPCCCMVKCRMLNSFFGLYFRPSPSPLLFANSLKIDNHGRLQHSLGGLWCLTLPHGGG